MHYKYLCTFGESDCRCPEGEDCAILLSPEDTSNYRITNELVCGPLLDDPLEGPLMVTPDTFKIAVVIDDNCLIGEGSGGGSGGGGGGGGGNSSGSRPLCLDEVVYEKVVGHSGNSYKIGLYFREPNYPIRTLPVVLLIHGMGAQCSRWDHTFGNWFAQDKFRVAAVNLFPHNLDAPPEAAGDMFSPNGRQLDELIDTLHAFLARRYPGWNNKIIAVAHSRAGLEVEDAIYIRGNRYLDGVVTIGTPFYGTPLADMGVGICEDRVGAALLCSPLINEDIALYLICVGAVSALKLLLCTAFPSDMYILTESAITNWRNTFRLKDSINRYPLKFDVGIGWTPEWKCGPFSGTNQAGCILMRYVSWAGCNDGAVPFYSTRRRWVDNASATYIFSKQPTSYSPLCEGNPREWEKDHTQSVESRDIYQKVEDRVRVLGSFLHVASLAEGPVPFSAPRSIPDNNPVVIYSRAFITAVNSNRIDVELAPGEDSILVWSSESITFKDAYVEGSHRLNGGNLYTVFPYKPRLNMKMANAGVELESTTFKPLFVIVADGDPLYVKLNKNTYLTNELIYIKAHYNGNGFDTIGAVFINTSTTPPTVYPVNFVRYGDTAYATTSLPQEGVYKLFVYAARVPLENYHVSPRSAIATVLVVKSKDMDRVVDVLTGKYPKGEERTPPGDGGKAPIHRDNLRVEQREGAYTIYNVAGYKVKGGRFRDHLVPLNGLGRGVYFVKVGARVYKVVR